jgi:hydroxymethylpyrimidine pyrophosphatase-like HAD family hydrolase
VIYATARGNTSMVVRNEWFDGCVKKGGAYAHAGEELVYSRVMPIETVRGLLIAADKEGLKTAAQTNDGIHYSNFHVSQEWTHITNYKIVNFTEINFDVDKIYSITETPEAVAFVKKHTSNGLHLFTSRDNITFIFHEEAVKSKAVEALAKYWGINRQDITAFGDDLIDAELLEYCGIGVAMGNALDEVKAAANYVCDTNNNDGVAKWIEENI